MILNAKQNKISVFILFKFTFLTRRDVCIAFQTYILNMKNSVIVIADTWCSVEANIVFYLEKSVLITMLNRRE